MPSMIRPKGKAKKIAYQLLGKPANMIVNRLEKKKIRLNSRLVAEETIRVR